MGIRTFAAWCKAAEVDEWTAMVRVAGSPSAMIFLRFAMLWGDAAAVKAAGGWFYQTANDFAVNCGLNRSQFEAARNDLKKRAGMSEQKRRIRLLGGNMLLKSCLHYRLDPLAVFTRFIWECLPTDHAARMGAKSLAGLLAIYTAELTISSNSGLSDFNKRDLLDFNNWCLSKFNNRRLLENDGQRLLETGKHEVSISNLLSKTLNQDSQSNQDSASGDAERDDLSAGIVHPGKLDLPNYLQGLYDTLGTPNGSTGKIIAACELIGAARAAEVAGRCENKAKSWQYVLFALKSEASKPEVQVVIAERECDEARWRQYDEDKAAGLLDDAPVFLFTDDSPTPLTEVIQQPDYVGEKAEIWATAYAQLQLQFDQAKFETWVRDARLIDYRGGVFVVEARNEKQREMLQNRLYRSVARVVSDALGSTAKIQFVTAQRVGVAS